MGKPCPAPRGGGPGAGAATPGAGRGAATLTGGQQAEGGGGRGRGGAAPTPEQLAAQQEAQAAERKWRQSLSMDIFKDLRKMYNDAGVSIYAVKNISTNMPDEELEFWFSIANALGCSHTTLELPSGPGAAEALKRLGDWGLNKKVYVAYHTHLQGSMTAFDEAFAISKGNMANVDLGHWTAGGNKGGTPLDFLNKYHGRISSFHLKDRTTPEHCELNLAWGTGETPIKEILQLVKKNRWDIPASVELEYPVPAGSDAVQEVRKCVEYCKASLA
jgi:sugar phosphate isomerase/epimerase